MKYLFSLIRQLEALRNGVPQFLFWNSVHPRTTVAVKRALLNFKKSNPECKEIDVIINSPGGQADDAYRIIKDFREAFTTVNIIIPFWAKSAATLMTFGGSNIIMHPNGELGPIDAQLGKERDDSP